MLDEMLDGINSSSDVIGALKHAYEKTPFIKKYMEIYVSDVFVDFDVETIKIEHYNYHRSMCGAYMLNRQTLNIFENVIFSPNVKIDTKIKQYKALSTMLYEKESLIFNAIITKNLESLYPNITFEIVAASI